MSCNRCFKQVAQAMRPYGVPDGGVPSPHHCPHCGGFLTTYGACNNPKCPLGRVGLKFEASLHKVLSEANLPDDLDKTPDFARWLAQKLVKEFTARLRRFSRPTSVEIRDGLIGRPRIVACKRLPESVPDAWGGNTDVDVVSIECGELTGYAGNGLGVFTFERRPEDYEQKRHPFFVLTRAQHDEAMRLLTEFVALDVEDYRGVQLGAVYGVWVRGDTPCEEWNSLVQEIEKRIKRLEMIKAEQEQQTIQELVARAKEIAETTGGISLLFQVEREQSKFAVNFYRVRVIQRGPGDLEHERDMTPREFEERLAEFTKRCSEWRQWSDNVDRARRGEIPVLVIREGDRCREYRMPQGAQKTGTWHIRVPSGVAGYVIGRKGRYVKALERMLGVRIRVHTYESAENTVWVERRLEPLDPPRF